jgi:hypothetical protein
MSGSRTKTLRRELREAGLAVTRMGWRRMKREWSGLSRPEKDTTTARDLVEDLKRRDAAKLEGRLKRLPRKRLEKLYRTITGRK